MIDLLQGDCVDVMSLMLADNSVDAIVTDPPYGIRFMGKSWDGADIERRSATRRGFSSHSPNAGPNGGHKSIAAEAGKYNLTPEGMHAFQEFSKEWAREAMRVLKPGGYLLSFSSPRTYHRMVCGIEDAGFEIRDCIMWVFGSGFPKSHNGDWGGTALKPAFEPIVMARKPLEGTVAANVLRWGTGGLNIDACRIVGGKARGGTGTIPCRHAEGSARNPPNKVAQEGRWPANFIHDGSDEALAAFPEAKGQQGVAKNDGKHTGNSVYSAMKNVTSNPIPRVESDTSAARFFYCAKASKKDRNEGCDGLPKGKAGMNSNTSGQHITRRDEGYSPEPVANTHPTVKPTDLMAYLCRLVTPVGGVILDPFLGSGSTGKAAVKEGFSFVGIEKEAQYLDIARARINHELAKNYE
jgi:site-specific DNA-methyltransferase (adenine-specific)